MSRLTKCHSYGLLLYLFPGHLAIYDKPKLDGENLQKTLIRNYPPPPLRFSENSSLMCHKFFGGLPSLRLETFCPDKIEDIQEGEEERKRRDERKRRTWKWKSKVIFNRWSSYYNDHEEKD